MRRNLISILVLFAVLLCGGVARSWGQDSEPRGTKAAPGSRDVPQPGTPAFAKYVTRLIEDLGSASFGVREAASQELLALGPAVRLVVEQAAKSDDREVAGRAAAILQKLPPLTHRLLDAAGTPIALAKVQFKLVPKSSAALAGTPRLVPLNVTPPAPPPNKLEAAEGVKPVAPAAPRPAAPSNSTLTDELGRLALPDFDAAQVECFLHVEHPSYGAAHAQVFRTDSLVTVYLPVVPADSELRGRAVSGTVVTSDGMPVRGAVIRCNEVRTPGQGLITGIEPHGDGLTDSQGRFHFYLPPRTNERQPSEVIPPNSEYVVRIDVPGDTAYFPTAGSYSNREPVRIVLERPRKQHRFRWESAAGEYLEKPEQFNNVYVDRLVTNEGRQHRVRVETASLLQGRAVPEGEYHAVWIDQGRSVNYQPLIVTAESPEELVFRLPPQVVYRGRVLHGVTGAPLAHAWVFGWRSTARQNLALLSDEEWKMLREAPANPPADHPAMKILQRHYGVEALVRADEDGSFVLTRRPNQEFYGLLAFAADHVPFRVYVAGLKPDAQQVVDVATLPLYPAAKVVVNPEFTGKRLSVSPSWLLTDEGQPSWHEGFRAHLQKSERTFEYVHWMTLNESQPIYVPADVRLRLRFDVPYDDEWTPGSIAEPIQLSAGKQQDLGSVTFGKSLPVEVQVVDSAGRPVEGFAVRRSYEPTRAWSISRNTNREGKVTFHVHPRSRGQFRVTDLAGAADVAQAANLLVDFQIEVLPPDRPLLITVTDQQIRLLREGKPR